MNVISSNPRGFCAGVVRAVDSVDDAFDRFGLPVFVLREIVHDPHVVGSLERRGAGFVDEVPDGAVVGFSAQGVGRAPERAASQSDLRVVDATCPLLRKVHLQAVVPRLSELWVESVRERPGIAEHAVFSSSTRAVTRDSIGRASRAG